MPSQVEIREWFEEGVRQGKTHMALLFDPFDFEDRAVYFNVPDERAGDEIGNMAIRGGLALIEVYHLGMSLEDQLKVFRVFNYRRAPVAAKGG